MRRFAWITRAGEKSRILLAASICLLAASVSQAAVIISEVAPWSSGNSPLGADWIELTNTGAAPVDITGWRVDDNSNSFAASLELTGITSIAAGESVIFIESAEPATIVPSFKTLWFGSSAPAGLQIGTYSGSGIGLSTGGDAVNIYDAGGALQANVIFGNSPVGPFPTFDNAAGLTGPISLLSTTGVNGALVAAGDSLEIGSPGTIRNIPEPAAGLLLAVALMPLLGVRKRQISS